MSEAKLEWGIRNTSTGAVFKCKDEKHARGLMFSTSVVLPPMNAREIVTREVGPWVTSTD